MWTVIDNITGEKLTTNNKLNAISIAENRLSAHKTLWYAKKYTHYPIKAKMTVVGKSIIIDKEEE